MRRSPRKQFLENAKKADFDLAEKIAQINGLIEDTKEDFNLSLDKYGLFKGETIDQIDQFIEKHKKNTALPLIQGVSSEQVQKNESKKEKEVWYKERWCDDFSPGEDDDFPVDEDLDAKRTRHLHHIIIGIASPEQIRGWAERRILTGAIVGKVTNPETVEYKTHKPITDGLFCERLFGPVVDKSCSCGKYGPNAKPPLEVTRGGGHIFVCPICEVEPASSSLRRVQLGFIQLFSAVTHLWYWQGKSSSIADFLGVKTGRLKNLINCTTFLLESERMPNDDGMLPLEKPISCDPLSGLSDEDLTPLYPGEDVLYRHVGKSVVAPSEKILWRSNPSHSLKCDTFSLESEGGAPNGAMSPWKEPVLPLVDCEFPLSDNIFSGSHLSHPLDEPLESGEGVYNRSHTFPASPLFTTPPFLRKYILHFLVESARIEDRPILPYCQLDRPAVKSSFSDLLTIYPMNRQQAVQEVLCHTGGDAIRHLLSKVDLPILLPQLLSQLSILEDNIFEKKCQELEFHFFRYKKVVSLSDDEITFSFFSKKKKKKYKTRYEKARKKIENKVQSLNEKGLVIKYNDKREVASIREAYVTKASNLRETAINPFFNRNRREDNCILKLLELGLGDKGKSIMTPFLYQKLGTWGALKELTPKSAFISNNGETAKIVRAKIRNQRRKTKKLIGKRSRLLRRIKLVHSFLMGGRKPEWMVLSNLPVLPPGLRPIIKTPDGIIASSDLNKLYRRILFANKSLEKLSILEVHTICLAKRSLQDAVDALIENGKGSGSGAVIDHNTGQPLKSLSASLKGKMGRFRHHLLGKRVDYSGRSVIIVGPTLHLHQCGLPREMAIELFSPFLIRYLLLQNFAKNVAKAKRYIARNQRLLWGILEQVMKHHPVLLNRAPTLHRLGIQAFQPTLVLGRAIHLHPLVCAGFNADFDGDQMGVHIPLSFQARAEAWRLLWSSNHILSPATGQPNLVPSQDMVLGCYYLTSFDRSRFASKAKRCDDFSIADALYFANVGDALGAYANRRMALHTPLWVRFAGIFESPTNSEEPLEIRIHSNGRRLSIRSEVQKITAKSGKKSRLVGRYIRTTAGRIVMHHITVPA